VARAASTAAAGIARAPSLLPLILSRTAHDLQRAPSHAPPRAVRARATADADDDASTWAHVDSRRPRGELCVLLGTPLT
jgi:hypothetical protein